MLCGSPIHNSKCAFISELRNLDIPIQYENQELNTPPPYPDKVFILGKVFFTPPRNRGGVIFLLQFVCVSVCVCVCVSVCPEFL